MRLQLFAKRRRKNPKGMMLCATHFSPGQTHILSGRDSRIHSRDSNALHELQLCDLTVGDIQISSIMSKFWQAGSSSESESGSDTESEDEQQTQRQAGGKFGSTFQESDSGEYRMRIISSFSFIYFMSVFYEL